MWFQLRQNSLTTLTASNAKSCDWSKFHCVSQDVYPRYGKLLLLPPLSFTNGRLRQPSLSRQPFLDFYSNQHDHAGSANLRLPSRSPASRATLHYKSHSGRDSRRSSIAWNGFRPARVNRPASDRSCWWVQSLRTWKGHGLACRRNKNSVVTEVQGAQ